LKAKTVAVTPNCISGEAKRHCTKHICVAIILWACIGDVLASDSGFDNSYPEKRFQWFFSVIAGECLDIGSWPAPPRSLPIYCSPVILPVDAICKPQAM
jgi:hypothetical protein